jgi:hypothetical protein
VETGFRKRSRTNKKIAVGDSCAGAVCPTRQGRRFL